MKELINELFKCPRKIDRLDEALEVITKHLPLKIHEWFGNENIWSWITPEGGLRIGEHTIKGKLDETIIIPIHLDHPQMANDNLSGTVVAIELAKQIKNPRYTYKFLFLPETIGTIAYLSRFGTQYKYGIVVDSVGGDGDLVTTLPKTPSLLPFYVSGKTNNFFSDEHLWSGNDERTLESVSISSIQISRAPFLEYHSEKDTPDRIDEKQLVDTLVYTKSIIDKIEKDFVPIPKYKGIPALSSNGLWKKEYGSPNAFMRVERIWHSLGYGLSIAQIADCHKLPFDLVYNFVKELQSKGLVC